MGSEGRLLASGRDSDIYEWGTGTVLRRSRNSRSLDREARVMDYVHEQGFPIPRVVEVIEEGRAIVMERIDGPSMMQALGRRPWQLGRQAAVLADLHSRLHEIEAPSWLRPAPGASGTALCHLDLHPLNVMIGTRGPVVIDWSNAARGNPAADVALTWIVLESGEIPAPTLIAAGMAKFRSRFVRQFVGHFDNDSIRRQVPIMVDFKVQDPNMSLAECAAMRRLAETVAGG